MIKIFSLSALLLMAPLVAQESPPAPPATEQPTTEQPMQAAPAKPMDHPSSDFSKDIEEGEQFFDVGEAPTNYQGAFLKMMLTLLGLILLIVISVWMLRRVSQGRMKQMNYGRNIKVLERRPLSAKSVLYLVEIAGKKVVIAESQLEVRRISSADTLTDED